MEPYQKYPSYKPLEQPRVRAALLLASGVMMAAAIGLVCFTIWGYGSVHLTDLPPTAAVYANGYKVTSDTLTLRPGTYRLTITSPTIDPYESTFRVGLFRQTMVNSPKLTSRNINAVASSLIGAIPGTSVPPTIANPRWFENKTWVAGLVGARDVLVMHYDVTKEQWSVAFLNSPGYSANLTRLPLDVVAYIQPLLVEGT